MSELYLTVTFFEGRMRGNRKSDGKPYDFYNVQVATVPRNENEKAKCAKISVPVKDGLNPPQTGIQYPAIIGSIRTYNDNYGTHFSADITIDPDYVS